MLYLNIITWEPPQREAVIKRFATEGVKLPAGYKSLGMWGDICGGRVFQLVDAGDARDPKAAFLTSHAWTDVCKLDSVAVMNIEEMMKVISSKK
jgi:hypothetical protein